MSSGNLIKLALQHFGCTQKELATKLEVSPAQISKWKADEHMSFDMEEKLDLLIGLDKRNPDVVAWTGGVEQADKWGKLVSYLAYSASQEGETGYITVPLEDDYDGLLCWNILNILQEAGVNIPKEFPSEIDFDYESDDDDSSEKFDCLYEENPFSKIISSSFRALTDVYGFYAAYFSDIMDNDDLELMESKAGNIESDLLGLAFCKVGEKSEFMPKFDDFKYRTLKDYQEWIEIVKNKAFLNNVPLKAELINMVLDGHDRLGHEAEAEYLGLTSKRLHPDVYMNEILQSHRIIQQVLPAICKKLDITEKELDIDLSKLYLK
ncbi:helix-turn-helix domain-containing protein [Pseudoalteromonas denitrificans]|uniref:HTH cro/C1-type domain-containing protein n=1 Tax=Pseudoalteromonas denitrificans DSM 6059 TaxID=1123010 RepID=A0A1I1JH05_9GAMM|nr:helix-turn-helix transcriptional regulator [Pseudoalteromonas denitrificans]SFC47635.1 hypothetical protein SAMN02745724_01743 [Pseudoalteromonas denitrificans DSM 6059]